uniref:Uncharacterized protein n=1 Tax=Arundo donax TaxID=35708 RepID=A0A0A9HFZ0_ARUDO
MQCFKSFLKSDFFLSNSSVNFSSLLVTISPKDFEATDGDILDGFPTRTMFSPVLDNFSTMLSIAALLGAVTRTRSPRWTTHAIR